MTFADSPLTFTDLGGEAWGSFRLSIGQKDVTVFRNVASQIAGFQLVEPYTYGPADFNLPQLSMFEVDAWGTGDLAWFQGEGTPVKLKQVDAAGALVRVVWKGFVGSTTVTSAGVQLHCEGDCVGRLSLRDHHPDLFALKRHVGHKIWQAFQYCKIDLSPTLGGDIGVLTSWRGSAGKKSDYVDSLLALTVQRDGSQYTIRAKDAGGYRLALKDTTTVDFTVFLGAHGVDPQFTRDISERITAVFGSGVAPSGLSWVNGKYPNLKQGEAPDYPMTDNSSFSEGTTDGDTDTGDGVTVMIYKLVGAGYLDFRDKPGGFDSDVTDAIKDLQEDASLTTSGNMNTITWNALWDLDVTGTALLQAYVAPLSEAPKVRKWNYTSNGSRASLNPSYDPSVIPVDLTVDHGAGVEKQRARKWSHGTRTRAAAAKQWAGTLTLTSDVFAGDRAYADVDLADHVMSRLDITEGMNGKVVNFDGDTLMHVSAADFSVSESAGVVANLALDTQARDAATLGEVIARNTEARTSARRTWKREHLGNVNFRDVEFSEAGGLIWNKVELPGNAWTVIKIPAGQAGNISRIRIKTENDEAAFVAALTAQKTSPAFYRQHVANPLEGGPVDDVILHHGGSGYTSAPTVSLSGGGGSGATATASVSGGQVVSLDLTAGGSGYTAPPSVSFSGGGGSGATSTASISLDDTKWTKAGILHFIDKQRSLLGVWGTPEQPCGYFPGRYTDKGGQATGGPITGVFLEDAGIDYHCFAEPVLYLAIYPDRDCVLKPQRILWDLMQNSAG